AAILKQEGKVLIAQRPKGDKLAGKWELPGGKVEAGETAEQCLCREMQEELNIQVQVQGFFASSDYHYENGSIRLLAYWAKLTGGEPIPLVHSQIRWAEPEHLLQFDFAPADIPIIEMLVNQQLERGNGKDE
ncbi:MAG TPA: (deoxy)nucleoside triphosphate pyrophosphohydrolase, partial [Bacillota bacterium]|nr:(deoxy)nucleoside triphosphate pyrophosphohydrolase [Bacillota bacterium]